MQVQLLRDEEEKRLSKTGVTDLIERAFVELVLKLGVEVV
jgi:hypothetical protein